MKKTIAAGLLALVLAACDVPMPGRAPTTTAPADIDQGKAIERCPSTLHSTWTLDRLGDADDAWCTSPAGVHFHVIDLDGNQFANGVDNLPEPGVGLVP